MTSYTIYLYDRDGPELCQTEFAHPLVSGALNSIRGHPGKASGFQGSFHWTAAVQALTILVLKTKAWGELLPETAASCPQPVLSGGKSSAAASLDYALSKQPAWLLDMFGTDKQGTPIARRVFSRTNPERRRPGPVMISLNVKAVDPKKLKVVLNDQEVCTPVKLFAVAEEIEKKWGIAGDAAEEETQSLDEVPLETSEESAQERISHSASHDIAQVSPQAAAFLDAQRALGPRPKPFQSEKWLSYTREVIKGDILRSLCSTDIFSKEGIERLLKSMNENPSFIEHAGDELFAPLDYEMFQKGLLRLGIAEDEKLLKDMLCQDEPLRVVASLGPGANLAIYTYLRYLKGYNLKLHYKYRSSTDLVNLLIDGDVAYRPDVLIISPGATARLLSSPIREEFTPLTFMPARPHAVLVPKSEKVDPENPYDGNYLVCDHGHKHSCFYFDSLIRSEIIDRNRIKVSHVSYEEALKALRENPDSLRLSTSLEYLRLIEWFHPFSVLETSRFEMSGLETVLFVHRSLAEDEKRTRALEVAVRDAWLDLAEDSAAVDLVLNLILEDREFLKVMKRTCGLYGHMIEKYAPAD